MAVERKKPESVLAHDLNNYLQIIMGNLEVLKRRGELVPEVVDAALDATRNAATLADRLLAFMRLQACEPRTVDLNRLLLDHSKSLAHTAGERVRVETKLSDDLRPVRADPRHLQAMLTELVMNARDAMPRGGQVRIRTLNASPDSVAIELSDTGPGMTAEEIAHAFDPLEAKKRSGRAAGVGLAIVDHCMRQAGGRVELGSERSGGTRVTLYFPASA